MGYDSIVSARLENKLPLSMTRSTHVGKDRGFSWE